MVVSLELCTHWVMEGFVANHYTARAFYGLGISIWGLGPKVSRVQFLVETGLRISMCRVPGRTKFCLLNCIQN